MTECRAIAKGVVYFGCTLEFMAGCTQARCWPLLLVCCEATKERDIGGIRHVLCTLEVSVGGKASRGGRQTPRFQLPVGFGYSAADWCTWNFVQQFTTHRLCSFHPVIHDAGTFQPGQENIKLLYTFDFL